MWYFAWILGVLLACAFGIINVLWLEAQESLQQDQVILDPLTRTPSRVEFLGTLQERIQNNDPEAPPFSLLLIGLNALKNLDETQQEQEINSLVLDFCQVIRDEIRQPPDSLARYDAATFAVILTNTTLDTAEAVANRICRRSEETFEPSGSLSGLSIGVAQYRNSSAPLDTPPQERLAQFLQSADLAMKQAASNEEALYNYLCVCET